MYSRAMFVAVAAGAIVSAAQAQVVLNEIYENPPGSGAQFDSRYEYIELYGFPGMDLTGYAIALLKGGSDLAGDGIPGPRPPEFDPGEEVPEIDEAFSLDGLTLGSNGFLVIYNTNPFLNPTSFLPPFFPPETNVATFQQTHIPSVDDVGRLANDGSSTYVLVRRRPNHTVVNANSVYGPGYSWRKDVQHDVDFDGMIDFGFETPVVYPLWPIDPSSIMEPYQMIDDVAWSHRSGKEYTRSTQDEISDTPNYNPDALSRLYYFGQNPLIGHRFNNSGNVVNTRRADEEWIQGTILESINPRFNYHVSSVVGNPRTKGPTDPNGPLYDGTCNPDVDPTCLPNPNGIYRFQDINLAGFQLTPGNFNDGGNAGLTQFRFIPGDLNFDGVVDNADLVLFDALLLGANFDATEVIIDPNTGFPLTNPNTGEALTRYVFQGRLANAFLAATNLDLTDGPGGTNAPSPTLADRGVLVTLIGGTTPCPFDVTGPSLDGIPDGQVNGFDLNYYIGLWVAGDPAADFTGPSLDGIPDGQVNAFDLNFYIDGWLNNQGACP